MTDYNPRPPPIGPGPGSKAGLYLIVGVLVVLVLASGMLFFNTSPPGGRSEQAQQPDRTINVPANPTTEPRLPRVPPAAEPRPEQPPKE